MNGGYHFADMQAYIPFAAYWDDYDKVPWILPFVYDYMEEQDAVSRNAPITGETYNRRNYLTCYDKQQKSEFAPSIWIETVNQTAIQETW